MEVSGFMSLRGKRGLVLTNGGRLFRGHLWHRMGEGERDCRMGYIQTAAHLALRTAKPKRPTGSQLRHLDMRRFHNLCHSRLPEGKGTMESTFHQKHQSQSVSKTESVYSGHSLRNSLSLWFFDSVATWQVMVGSRGWEGQLRS